MQVKIMRGIPGSGKTTFIKKNYPGALVCSADDYFMKKGMHLFNPSKLTEAHGACLRKFMDAIVVNENNMKVNHPDVPHSVIVVDNPNTRLMEVAPYAAVALACKYELEVITIMSLPQESFDRQVHKVPLQTINRMYSNLMDSMYEFPSYWPHTIIPR